MIDDLQNHWWDASRSHIRPTRGDHSSPTVIDVGTVNDSAAKPSFWQMAEYANVQYWDWKISHSEKAKSKIVSQWQYIRSVFPDTALSSASSKSGTINVSDDAAWVLGYLVQAHEVTGDRRALNDAVNLLPSILERFADPNSPRVAYGALKASPHGILYATPSGDPDHQGVSTTYEIMIANSAIYLYEQTHNEDYLKYAKGTYEWTQKYLKHPARNYYYGSLDIRPTLKGKKNDHYLKPMGDNFGPPVRGLSSSYSGGTMAMAVCAARLYKTTGEKQYLKEAQKIVSHYTRPHCFGRPGNVLVNEQDAWTDGHWAPYYADEVLSLEGVDEDRKMKQALHNTALSIIAQRTADGYYGPDWSGPEKNPNNGTTTWVEQAKVGTGSGRGMALPEQIMTSSTSAAMVTAAMVLDSASPH